ncbi:unnamed protein product [Nesidiocoris tenuis]|uniref:Uncharacterized protein n=1 Tax=Nesidiocoris tenuis TaxID=355587 RepID=A0A6H5HB11_9HEMI|nr:unnamed protein product [Nesidiocoris tenuis]
MRNLFSPELLSITKHPVNCNYVPLLKRWMGPGNSLEAGTGGRNGLDVCELTAFCVRTRNKSDYLSDYHNVYDRPFFSDGKDEQWQQLIITKASSPAPPKLQPNYANESSKCLGQQSDERSDRTTMACEEAKPTIATSSSQANDVSQVTGP